MPIHFHGVVYMDSHFQKISRDIHKEKMVLLTNKS